MAPRMFDPADHARARRIAERQQLVDALLAEAGVTRRAEQVTEPIAVIPRTERPVSWLSW